MTTRLHGRVEGVVQGVGFRPFAHRLAAELQLGGFVRNDERGVELEVEGAEEAVAAFRARLGAEAPPLAVVEAVALAPRRAARRARVRDPGQPRRWRGGRAPSRPTRRPATTCLRELCDPADRRFRYPFVNCTNCGPRFTIVRGVPYDRARTTMAGFALCGACRAEYEDPADRRYHAQPIACPACGPQRLDPQRGLRPTRSASPAGRSPTGAIVAVKGLGGYHLACRRRRRGGRRAAAARASTARTSRSR